MKPKSGARRSARPTSRRNEASLQRHSEKDVMKLPRRQFLHLAAGAAALPAVSRIARAQAYPSRPVRRSLRLLPGGATDILARLMGQWLSERLGQPFVIENRPGRAAISRPRRSWSPPDGHTLLLVGRRTQSTPRSTTSSIQFSPRHRSGRRRHRGPNVMVVIRRFPQRPFPSLSPMPRPIPARSTWRRPARERTHVPANCSR